MKTTRFALSLALMLPLFSFAAVDLNKATQAELESVNGIGPAKAKAIIEYRQKNGAFKTVDDLDKVPGFGKKSLDAMKKDISVGNATAAAAGKTSDLKSVKDAAAGKSDAKPDPKTSKK